MQADAQIQVGLIGLGSVGKSLARAIVEGQAGAAALRAVLVRPSNRPAAGRFLADLRLAPLLTDNPEEFFAADTDLVVEVAGQDALRAYAARVLAGRRDLLVCATGAFVDDRLYHDLADLARRAGRKLIIPAGAIAGIDALSSAVLAGVSQVSITTRKPPLAWVGTIAETMVDLKSITERPVCLYEGPAREAARLFPQNVNVAATLACAGIGLDRTLARVFADPTIGQNRHEISISGRCGELKIEVCGQPSPDNPRTSALTAYSVIKAVRNLTAPVIFS